MDLRQSKKLTNPYFNPLRHGTTHGASRLEKRSMGEIITDQLRPFSFVMRKQLARKGYNVKGVPFRNVVPLYYNELVSNKNIEKNSYDPINAYDFANHTAFYIKPRDTVNGDLKDMRVLGYFDELQKVVDNTIDTFRVSRAKYNVSHFEGLDPYNVMTPDEVTQAKAAIKVQKDLEYKAIMNEPIRMATLKNILKVVIVVLILYYLLK
jgi:hypothetical protein